jgi:hypothetical protein
VLHRIAFPVVSEWYQSRDAFGGFCHRRQHGQGVGLTTALTGVGKGAKQETCVARSLSTVAVEHPRSGISTQHHNMYESAGVDSLRSEPCGFEAPFSMHDTVCRLLRIPLPRTRVKKGARRAGCNLARL